MSVSEHVELDLLNRCFQLEHFHGLRKPSDADVLSGPSPQPSPTPSPGVLFLSMLPILSYKTQLCLHSDIQIPVLHWLMFLLYFMCVLYLYCTFILYFFLSHLWRTVLTSYSMHVMYSYSGDSRPGSAAKRASKSHSAKSSEKPMSAVSRSQVSSRATPNAASRLSSAGAA